MNARKQHAVIKQPVDMLKKSRVEQLQEENLKLRRVLMEQPDYSWLIIQLAEALETVDGTEAWANKTNAALDAYHAWQEGDL